MTVLAKVAEGICRSNSTSLPLSQLMCTSIIVASRLFKSAPLGAFNRLALCNRCLLLEPGEFIALYVECYTNSLACGSWLLLLLQQQCWLTCTASSAAHPGWAVPACSVLIECSVFHDEHQNEHAATGEAPSLTTCTPHHTNSMN